MFNLTLAYYEKYYGSNKEEEFDQPMELSMCFHHDNTKLEIDDTPPFESRGIFMMGEEDHFQEEYIFTQ